ncbi:MAG: MFS transporter [Eggerthellaceae bacterium]|nr:MFS transporter [Eggerthellaceae bacterium]
MPDCADNTGTLSPANSSATPKRAKKAQAPLWTKDFVVGTITNFVLSCNYFMLTVVMTAYAMDVFQAPASLAAFCASIFIVGTLFARFASPALMRKVGRKRLLLIGAFLGACLTGLYLLDMPLAALMGVRFAHGFMYGVCSTTVATIVTAIVPTTRKGEGIGYYMLSVTLGAAIGPFAGILLSRYVGYAALFIVAAAVLVVALPCILAIREPKRAMSADQAGEELASDELEGSAEGKREERESERTQRKGARKRRSGLDAFIERSTIPIAIVCSLTFFAYSSLLTFLTPFSETVGLTRAASVFFIVYAFSMFVTRPFTGRAFDRQGPLPVMLPAFISFAAGMVVLAFASNDWMMLGSALLCGYGVGCVQACGLAMAVKAAADSRLSVANATFYMSLDIGVGIGPLLLGALVPIIGYEWLYLCMGIVGIVALAVFLVVRRYYE